MRQLGQRKALFLGWNTGKRANRRPMRFGLSRMIAHAKSLSMIAAVIMVAGCSKVPLPRGETGVLVIPFSAVSKDKVGFAYRYELITEPKSRREIHIRPTVNMDYIVIPGFHPGKYRFVELRSYGRRNTTVFAMKRKKKPQPLDISFEIKPQTVTILSQEVNVESIRKIKKIADAEINFWPISYSKYSGLKQQLTQSGFFKRWNYQP